jgi:hypothetical protein
MTYVKSFLGGVAALVLAALIGYALALGVPRVMELVLSGQGGIGVYEIAPWIPLWSIVVVALLVFAAGFYWTLRRVRHQR